MTEKEWLTCTDPNPMLAFLRGKASDRKLRLFACACCRRVWHRLTDERSRRAVEVAEQHADGFASIEEMESVREKAAHAYFEIFVGDSLSRGAAHGALSLVSGDWNANVLVRGHREAYAAAIDAAEGTCYPFRRVVGMKRRSKAVRVAQKDSFRKMQQSRAHQAVLIREVFGPLPFRSVEIDSSWLSWNNGIILKMAEAIYEQRDFASLPILADALEEAGCTNADILQHCRQPGEHVRGCWVVDLLLGKS